MGKLSFEQKIEILAKQALDYCNENGLKFRQYNEKFAELIIKDCLLQAEREMLRNGTDSVHNIAIRKVMESIQKHFGVVP